MQISKYILQTAKLLVFGLVLTISVSGFAAKGTSKAKKGVVLKFNGFNLNSFTTTSLYGAYKGSYSSILKTPNNQTVINSIVTYKRGNSTFILPYKHKLAGPTLIIKLK
jgi:hypothetical protein